jgi:hypothetical protein
LKCPSLNLGVGVALLRAHHREAVLAFGVQVGDVGRRRVAAKVEAKLGEEAFRGDGDELALARILHVEAEALVLTKEQKQILHVPSGHPKRDVRVEQASRYKVKLYCVGGLRQVL